MPLLSQPSSAARTSLFYITVGALMVVWTGIWFAYLNSNPPESPSVYYWCTGFMVSGVTLLVIGLALGRIGRAARHAELPPPEVTAPVATAEQTGPVNPAAPVAGNGPVAGGVPAGRPG
jgi:hypothetical protein